LDLKLYGHGNEHCCKIWQCGMVSINVSISESDDFVVKIVEEVAKMFT
jgi:hypothetical protein